MASFQSRDRRKKLPCHFFVTLFLFSQNKCLKSRVSLHTGTSQHDQPRSVCLADTHGSRLAYWTVKEWDWEAGVGVLRLAWEAGGHGEVLYTSPGFGREPALRSSVGRTPGAEGTGKAWPWVRNALGLVGKQEKGTRNRAQARRGWGGGKVRMEREGQGMAGVWAALTPRACWRRSHQP